MNRHLHRVVFNAARGMRMVVQETATSIGKGASRATTAAGAAALAGVLIAGAAHGQIAGAPNVPGNLRPTVLTAPNGVPLVNIQTPSSAGVSRNVYNQFSVGANGAILNNSRVNVQTQLGGFVQGNPNLATGPARIILNEVNGGTPSQLRGYIEVGGQRAEVIIANPAGISVDGGGFINASRATLTTGTPQFNAVGGLDSFLVRGGTVTIDGAGLDASKTDYAAILARAVQANASIWASELKVVTGANQISADHSQITPTTGTGTAPTFALDVAALGGMYANKIVLIGSEAGLGVRNAGSIGAGAGGLVVTAAGRLENIGTLEGQRVELTTPGDISNRGGTIRQGSSAGLTIASPVLSNTNGGVVGAEPVSSGASGGGTATPEASMPSSGGGTATPSTTDAGGTSTGGSSTPANYTPPAPGLIAAGGTISNDGGKIYAGGPITLNTPQVNNAGGSLNVATMAVAGPSFSNAGGTLNVSQSFGANVGTFDNTGGKLNAGSLNIATSGDLLNTDGVLSSATDTGLTVGGMLENTRGSLSAAGAMSAKVAGASINNSGTLTSNQALTLNAGSLQNTQGSIQSAQSSVQLGVTSVLSNGSGGSIDAATDVNVQAGSLANSGSMRGANDANIAVGTALTNDGNVTAGRNTTITAGSVQGGSASVFGAGVQSDGKLGGTGDLRMTVSGALAANGTNLAAGNATLQGASVDLSRSQTSAADVVVTATQGNVVTSKASVVTPGTLSITANAQPGQTLVNEGGQLNAGQLNLSVSNIANTGGGEIVQTGAGVTRIVTSGAIDNSGATLASNGGLDLAAASLTNKGGTLRAAQTSDLTVTVAGLVDNRQGEMSAGGNAALKAGSLDNDAGRLTAAGDVSSTTSGATSNQGGTVAANRSTTLTAASLDNTGGTVSALNTLTAQVQGAVTNTTGTLVANQALVLGAGSLGNDKGSIQSTQAAAQLNVSGALANASGYVAAATNLTVKAGSLSNAGSLRGGNDASLLVDGQLANDGSITARRNTSVAAGSVQGGSSGVMGAGIESDGKLGATGVLRVSASGALVAMGTNLAAGNTTLQGASVDLSASQTSAANIAITATQGDVITSKAKVFTPGVLVITATGNSAQTLVNEVGQLNARQLQISASNIANTNAGEIVQTGAGATTIAVSGTLNNDGSRIASNGQDLTLQVGAATNNAGRIEHAGNGTLTIAGGSFDGANGQITTNNALVVAMTGAFNQDGSKAATSAKQITIDAASLSNRGGQIVQTGSDATRITVVGALDNSNAGVIASNGNISIRAGGLLNRGGSIRAAEASSLGLNVGGLLDNSSKGVIGAGGNTTIAAGSLNNNAGSVTAVGDLGATIAGTATNVGGTLAANGNTTVGAASLDNSAGTTAAVNGKLAVTTMGQTINNSGTLQAGAITTLSNGGLLNRSGKVFGDSLSVDTRGNALDNGASGTMAATTTVAISSGALTNDAGLIQSGGAMTINTNGQSLSNTNASSYSNQQGGITSADTLDLKTGALNNTAGFVGSKNALTADTLAFTNTGGGLVLGQSAVSINTHGASYKNNGGKTQAAGNVSINASDIQNSSGLVRSLATTTLNAGSIVNTNTQGTDQGIEGKNVVIGTGALNNDAGAIRADVNATITSGGTVSNKSGLVSAGDTLAVVDPNAANPGAKTLNLVNTNGTLVADKSLKIDAATFSGDGRAVSGKDLGIALKQDIVNNGEVSANGNLSYTTTGNFTNNGKLLAGQTLTVGGNNVDNTANAEMSGPNTVVNASGTLTNRGLIDSRGATQINAGTLKNIGTGRIYGDAISIGVGALENGAETANGVTKAATIAARDTLDMGAGSITNREHALIFSSGDMFIGGGLNANRQATGQGGTLDNLSADIESLGDMTISMANVNNRDVHIQMGTPKVTSEVLTGIAPKTLVGSGVGRTTTYPLNEVNVDPASGSVFRKDTGELVGIGGYAIWTNNLTTTEDTAINIDPARLVAGGNLSVNGRLYNENGQVLAGGTITATSYQSSQLNGQRTVTGLANVIDNQGAVQGVNIPLFAAPTSVSLGAYKYQEHINASQGFNAGVAPVGGATGNASGAGAVNGGSGPGVVVEVAANVGGVIRADGQRAGGASGASGPVGTAGTVAGTSTTNVAVSGPAQGADSSAQAGASRTVPMVVRTSTPGIGIPTASLFSIRTGGSYLVETDPRFANYRNWLSSDYLLNSLSLDPNHILKRLGDGFYEQKLIREQVAQLTGYRYLDGYSNDEEQYAALMNAGATFAQQYGLRPGVALTAAQMAQLTSDIVWLVEQTVTLPDGTTQRVLVPQVYVRVRPGDIDGSGALLAGNQVKIDGKDNNLVNTGTIAGRQLVSINANTIDNLGGRISGGQVGLKAQLDINNLGGVIDARDKLTLEAGRDINVRTTTASGPLGNTGIDRVAGLYVTNPGGTLVASAGRDINLVGAIVSNQGGGGLTSFTAKNDINLGTVTTSSAILALGEKWSGYSITNKEVGTTITTNGTTLLNAGRDINARQATVDAGNGLLSMHADRDINIAAGQIDVSGAFMREWKEKGLFSRTDNTLSGEYNFRASVGSRFSGGVVSMDAGRDIGIEGSHISGTQGVAISATRNLAIVEGRNTGSVSAELQSNKKGIGGLTGLLAGTPTMPSLPYGKATTTSASVQTDTASASTITSSQGGVLLQGGSVFLQGVQVDAAKDISIKGGNVVIQAATNSSSVTGSTNSRTRGIEPGQILWHDPSTGINARKATETKVEDSSLTRTTLNGANVSIEAVDTLAMAGTTVNTPGTLTLQADQLLLGTQTTEHSEQTTSQGRDLAYQKNKDKGQSDQTTNYNQFNSGNLTVTANHIQAGLGARDSVEQLAKQPGMGWVDQLTNDPKLKDKIDWQRVEEAHKNWNYDQQGLTPEGAAIVTIVAAYFTAGAASELGAAAGEAAGTAVNGGVAVLGEGGFIASTGFTVSTVVSGAVTAGISALAGQAAVALINNQGDLAAALHDLGSSANVKNLLTAIVTGGVLGVMDLNPTGSPTLNGGAQPFVDQLRQNLIASAARAVIGTAINGGSFEKNLKESLENAILDTVAAQTAYEIGNLTQAGVIDDFTNKVAHAIAGCMVGAARADNAAGCGAGALGAAIGELAAETYGKRADTTQFAAMISGLAVAITGGDAAQINLGSQAGSNAAANNYLSHDEDVARKKARADCYSGNDKACAEAARLDNLDFRRDQRVTALASSCTVDCSKVVEFINKEIAALGCGNGPYVCDDATLRQAWSTAQVNAQALQAGMGPEDVALLAYGLARGGIRLIEVLGSAGRETRIFVPEALSSARAASESAAEVGAGSAAWKAPAGYDAFNLPGLPARSRGIVDTTTGEVKVLSGTGQIVDVPPSPLPPWTAAVDNSNIRITWGRGNQAQGMPWEDYIATQMPANARLPQNFDVFDFFDPRTGIATSAKTLDTLTAAKIKDPTSVYYSIKKNVDAAANFTDATLSGVTLDSSKIVGRELVIAVPAATTPAQWGQIFNAISYGQSVGVKVIVSAIH
ncbi:MULTISPECIES: two-partner secretion domain-containing protein [unclassified Variovorax]|uniref:two-partner secretion domain-containing protein n=1 Tax=unclassified Variovorax TaxID=663243 RepID=UPI000D12C8D7|nr:MULTISPECIES: filamentous hemagglutinin N-terminal domain-containing protein [unclassified Variovorax]AVQ79661.1 filamentous hemagglutinin [Variovorax sp. PMC12]QRY31008.1 filamentous hemagglutinin N-terminal domain-containing protein [Variovorax sp. PDNC026]